MADFYGSVFTAAKGGTLPQAVPSGIYVGSKRRSHVEVFTLAAQASGSRLYCGTLPIGAIFVALELTASVSLGTTTVSAGSAASPAKYRAAAVFTAVDTPTPNATAAGKAQAPLTAPEDVWLTTGAAAAPGAGTLVTELIYKTQA